MSMRLKICMLIIFLHVAMLLGIGVSAEEYPESEHPYANNSDVTWTYTHPEEAEVLKIVFSADAYLGYADYLYITDENGSERRYSGTQLSDATIVLSGDSFTLRLTSNDSNTYYGFAIIEIIGMTQEEYDASVSLSISSDGIITGYSGFPCNLVIPDTIDEIKVTAIGDHAFSDCISLTSITIPESITSIGYEAFHGCINLANVYAGNAESWLGIAFSNEASNPIIYGANLYFNGVLVENITIPDGVTAIGNYAFYNCSSLISVTIPDGVTSIGSSAFSVCGYLISITIPDSVTSIGNSAFEDCISLTSITIPNGVTSIGNGVFHSCKSLTSVTIPDGITSIGYGAFFSCKGLTSIIIPDSITTIDRSAFAYCSSLTSVTMGESVTTIGDCAFMECINLTSITISDSVASIGWGAFFGCEGLTSITISDSVTTIGESVFAYCRSLTSISIPESVTSISRCTFSECTSLTSVTIGDSVTTIGDHAFKNCISLTSISIPDSVTTIGEGAFDSCTSLTSITIGKSVTSVGIEAFNDCVNLISIIIPDSVTTIGDRAFDSCTNLTNVTIGDSVTSVGIEAFNDCVNLISISIPDNVTTIGDRAFVNCTNLTNVTIGDSVTSIGDGAFEGCTNLISIIIPDNVTTIGDRAFVNCSSLTSVTIGDSVTTIGDHAFAFCSSLASINIPEGVTSIGVTAFMECSSLISVSLPESITSLGDSVFYCCHNLEEVHFPTLEGWLNSKIYGYHEAHNPMFYADKLYIGGELLTHAEIPEGIASIRDSAFYNCSSLTSVTIPKGVTSIGESAFQNCSSLTSIIIPEGVTEIGNLAFYSCDNLTSITFPESLTTIGHKAFQYCYNLLNIVFSGQKEPVYDLNYDDGFQYTSSDPWGKPLFTVYCREFTPVDYWAESRGYKIEYLENMDEDTLITFELSAYNTTLPVGESVTIIARTFPAQEVAEIQWSSSAPEVASVSNGVITTLSGGSAIITASWGNQSVSMKVNVYVDAEEIIFPDELWVVAKERIYVEYDAAPKGGRVNLSYDYDSAAIEVWNYGDALEIRGKLPGDTIITLTENYTGITHECTVHIFYPVTSIEFSTEKFELTVGDSAQLSAAVIARMDELVNKLVTFSSSDESVATVDENGVVTAHAIGNTTITATAASGVTGECVVIVCESEVLLLPDGLTSIESEAFAGMNAEQIVIPASVESIDSRAFADCNKLRVVEFEGDVASIAEDAFEGCEEITFICPAGSTAEVFAGANGFKVESN